MPKTPSSKITKAAWTLRHEGPAAFASKSRKYFQKRFGRLGQATENYHYAANPLFHISQKDLDASRKVNQQKYDNVKSALWFVPYFDHINYGGIRTIFRFMEYFSLQGVRTTIVIYDKQYLDKDRTKTEIVTHCPGLGDAEIIIFDPSTQKISDLPAADIGFSTIWQSAYLLLRYNQTMHKFYFAQDYEPLFYEGGSISALAESTYRFGFTGVVNTPGLLWALNQRHGFEGVSFIPAVDSTIYHPAIQSRSNKRTKIFFYARPHNPRNAFDLGILIIKELLLRYGDKIEVVTAGANWDERVYGLEGRITNLKLLQDPKAVGDLYRSCDIGFVYMLSKHPSYQPFEFMATGMATVSNRNEDNLWFFKDGENCLLAEPSPTDMADKIGQLVDDPKLRAKIAQTGQKNINFDWDSQLAAIWSNIRAKQ